MTPLHNACASNNNSSLLVLQKRDNKSSSVSLLLLSSLNGCFNTIQTLLKLYPNSLLQKSDDLFDCKDPNGNTQGKIIPRFQIRYIIYNLYEYFSLRCALYSHMEK